MACFWGFNLSLACSPRGGVCVCVGGGGGGGHVTIEPHNHRTSKAGENKLLGNGAAAEGYVYSAVPSTAIACGAAPQPTHIPGHRPQHLRQVCGASWRPGGPGRSCHGLRSCLCGRPVLHVHRPPEGSQHQGILHHIPACPLPTCLLKVLAPTACPLCSSAPRRAATPSYFAFFIQNALSLPAWNACPQACPLNQLAIKRVAAPRSAP